MPLPVVMVAWVTIRSIRQSQFDEQWPPVDVSADDPVKVRRALRQVVDKGADEEHQNSIEFYQTLTHLLDEVVPALRTRRAERRFGISATDVGPCRGRILT
ncbi:hypothetical protein O7632_30300 [Solwaraspora sp. WMMD406]|uniref:hypothetical protein n=1 Tax=Solwaraspora sp. WMMD406 TaxID=3016095 RepID=UPI002417B081|nr:hypothetical protein [Solwaraspora sp. WMMD406]MDG4768351.1 hypothetical protein [Solwaraspora sp. WMMD406]